MRIGYIGLGALGSELARRFLPAHALSVWDLNSAAEQRLAAQGARVAASPAALARECDVVLLCLPRSSDVRQVVFGPDGLAGALAPGALVIDQTSGIPQETRAIAEQLAVSGIAMLDAAVSASPHIVAAGGATLMTSGPDAVYERALPVLHIIAGTVIRCGARVGDGQAMKMVNNAMNAGCRLGTLELAALGRKAGVPLATLNRVLNDGGARNQTTEKMLPAIAEGKSSTNFALPLMLKDINQAVALGMEAGVPMPLNSVVRGLLQIGVNTLGSKAQLEDMIGLTESMAGVRLAGADADADANVNDAAPAQDSATTAQLINNALAALCAAVTYECVAAGHKYGLRLADMAQVLVKTSGWSAAARGILPALASGGQVSDVPLQAVRGDLRQVADLAMHHGTPLLLCNVVLSLVETAANQFGADAGSARLAQLAETMAAIRFDA